MRKAIIIPALLVIVFVIGAFYLLMTKAPVNPPPPSPIAATPIDNDSGFCKPEDLEGSISLDAGAGNIYGKLAIQNTSVNPCQIIGNNFIEPKFVAQNISVSNLGTPGPDIFNLSPNQTVYSQVHFPNGPQCGGPVEEKDVLFRYQISPANFLTFKDQSGKDKQIIEACKSEAQDTEINVWSLSENPVNQ